jgi:hypothetical protein
LRLEVAPLRIDGNGTFNQPVNFAGTTFSPGTPTEGKYKFDTYRVSYRYLFLNKNHGACMSALRFWYVMPK